MPQGNGLVYARRFEKRWFPSRMAMPFRLTMHIIETCHSNDFGPKISVWSSGMANHTIGGMFPFFGSQWYYSPTVCTWPMHCNYKEGSCSFHRCRECHNRPCEDQVLQGSVQGGSKKIEECWGAHWHWCLSIPQADPPRMGTRCSAFFPVARSGHFQAYLGESACACE